MIVHTTVSAPAQSQPTITQAVVTAVSDAEDCDSASLPPLWDVIDPEAMEAVFAPVRNGGPRAGQFEFEYAGYAVTVAVDTDARATVSLETLPVADDH